MNGGLSILVGLLQRIGRNTFIFRIDDRTIRVRFATVEGFRTFYGLVEDGVVAAENLDATYLLAPDSADAIVDVGAHYGMYTVPFGLLNPELPLYAFEPDEHNRTVLTDHLARNELDAVVLEAVVSDHDGEISFYTRPDAGSQGHSTTSLGRGSRMVRRSATALSRFLETAAIRRPYLKIDAEGEEYRIARDLIEADLETFWALVEVHPDKLDVSTDAIRELFAERGFAFEEVTDDRADGPNDRPIYFVHEVSGD